MRSHKTSSERNELGQFATPKLLADAIVQEALSYINQDSTITFLEPAIGTGVFYSALLDSVDKSKIKRAQGYEVDEHYALPSIELWSDSGLEYKLSDFLKNQPPKDNSNKFNLIISNPPYVRHHHLKNGIKNQLIDKVFEYFGIKFSGLSGLYCYFLALTSLWLKENGISAWLIPGEFLDVNYGYNVKEFLLTKVKLLRIHRFQPESVQFNDALVSSVVVFYSSGVTDDPVSFTTGENISKPISENLLCKSQLNKNDKWSQWFFQTIPSCFSSKRIGDYFSVKRGIATGANNYFILTKSQIDQYQVPTDCIKPILPNPRYLKKTIIDSDLEGKPINVKEEYLLDIPYNNDQLSLLPKKFLEYLDNSYKLLKYNYLISKRSPWYKQEYRPRCPFLMTYMGRNSLNPFRLILNKSKAVVTNVYLMLYPKFDWEKVEEQNPGFLKQLFIELSNIKGSTYISTGRVYGGGLYKIEPKELMNTPVDGIISVKNIELIQSSLKQENQLSLF